MALSVWVTSSPHRTTVHHSGEAMAEPQPQLCCAFWAVQLESGEGWLSGERHTGPNLSSPTGAAHCSWPKDRLWALAVNICSRDCTICPEARGEHLSPFQTSCRAPDVDLSSPTEEENTAKTQSELQHLSHTVSCVLSVDHYHREVQTFYSSVAKTKCIIYHGDSSKFKELISKLTNKPEICWSRRKMR